MNLAKKHMIVFFINLLLCQQYFHLINNPHFEGIYEYATDIG
jgi:hypothetical protein